MSTIEDLVQWTTDIAAKPWLRIKDIFRKEVLESMVRVTIVERHQCPHYTRDFDQTDVDGLAADGFSVQVLPNIIAPSIDSAVAKSCYDLGDIEHAKIAARDAWRPKTILVIGLASADVQALVDQLTDVTDELNRILSS
jgi:hypothetical protein